MTCHMSIELGGYVLHALEVRDERAVQQHLAECDECLQEVGDLAFAASLLALVRPDADLLDDGVAAEARRPTRRLRRLSIAAAACAALVATAAVTPATHLFAPDDRAPQAVVLEGVGRTPPVHAEVDVTPRHDGTGLHLTLSGAPAHGWCSLVARAADGRSEVVATWPADGHGRVAVSGSTAIPVAELSDLAVVTDAGDRLVHISVPHTDP